MLITAASAAEPDSPFGQEFRDEITYPAGVRNVRAAAASSDGALWIAARTGVYRYAAGAWQSQFSESCYALVEWRGEMWAGCWDGVRNLSRQEKVNEIEGPVPALWAGDSLVAATQTSLHELDSGKWKRIAWPGSKAVRGLARDGEGALWVATGMGAWRLKGGAWSELHDESQLLSGELRGIAAASDGTLWLAGTGGVDTYRGARRIASYDDRSGLASQAITGIAAASDGGVWIGTEQGAIRRTRDGWSLRHSRRWLADDHVLAIAPARDGTVWVATLKGVSAIRRRNMTLEAKAAHYLAICRARHVRPPGLVEQCDLARQGDVTSVTPRDDDNDGQYTSMYLAMESFRYAVTRSEDARKNAREAFHALRFLREVTGTPGFVARTVVPAGWTRLHDPNLSYTPQARADHRVDNPRFKQVEVRWRPSADGKWLWKGDTSSDEITGHLYGYFIYYSLAADEEDKAEVREHVARVVDYIVDGGYTLRDTDGQPTRWGIWAPQFLNGNPDWRAERWTNGLEILSYLRTAEFITGDSKYRKHYLELIEKHGYGRLARRPLATEPSEKTHFDNELVALALPGALSEKDPKVRAIFEEALEFWKPHIAAQKSAYFAFTWAALAGRPGGLDLHQVIDALRDEPLDLVQWTVDNRWRRDLALVRSPQVEELQLDRVLAPSERAPMRWDGNPWSAVRGENGMSESSGVHWLLPYWMGRYYGFIGGPQTK